MTQPSPNMDDSVDVGWWTPQFYHRIGWQKTRHESLEHPALEGWKWDSFSKDEAVGEHILFHNNLTVDMEGVMESTDKLESQSLALSKMAANMKSGSSPIHYSNNELLVASNLGFPPPLFAYQTETVATQQMIVAHQRAFDAQALALLESERSRAPRNLGSLHQSTRSISHRGAHLLEQSEQQSFRPESGQGYFTTATPSATPPQPRQRFLSPGDISKLTQQAARRSAAREILAAQGANVKISRPQSHLSQNVYGVRNSSSPLAMTHYPQRLQSERIEYIPASRSARDLYMPRSKGVLGCDPSLKDNMPSQMSRQTPVEIAAATEVHAARVRSMQSNLAADPNIMAQAPPPVQLVAQGPPLTGHNTTSTATLPSVLQPYSRTPMMTYAQALQAIIAETGSLQMLLRLELLDPAPVTVLLYDDNNRLTGTSEDLILTKDTNLKTLVTFLQNVLDAETATMPGNDGGRFLLTHIEVRNGTEEMRNGHPALKGECRGGDKVKSATFMRWITNGDMEMYWKAYRIVLQTQAPQAGDKKPVVKPIFRVKTVRQVLDARGTIPEGHQFVDVLSLVSGSGATYHTGQGGYDGDDPGHSASKKSNDYLRSAILRDRSGSATQSKGESTTKSGGRFASSSKGSQAPTSSRGTDMANFGGDAAASTPGSTNDGSGNDGGPSKNKTNDAKPSETKGNAVDVDLTRNWGYYQRMGGDPDDHKTYDLSHVPFEVENFPGPKIVFDTALEQAIVARNQRQGWNFESLQGTLISEYRAPAAYSAGEQRRVGDYARKFDAARSFEDDDSFFPIYKTGIPDARKIATFQQMSDQPQSGNDKGKEPEADRYFNIPCAPDCSQEQRILSSVDSLNSGKAHAIDRNTSSGGYAIPQGGDIEASGHGSGIDSHARNRAKSKQSWSTKNSDIQNVYDRLDPNHAGLDRGISRYAYNFNNDPANARSPFMKGSAMNVHAPEYRSNSSTLTPYLQSLFGPSPSYTQPISHGQNQRSNLVSPVGAMDAVDGFTTITMPNVQAERSNSRARRSPENRYTASSNTASPKWKPSQVVSSGMVPSSGASSPEKAYFSSGRGSRFQSPDRRGTQTRGHGQKIRSPEKFKIVGHGGNLLIPYPSPEKTAARPDQAWDFRRDPTTGPAQIMHYPHFNEHDTQDPRPGFQYGPNSDLKVNFEYNPHAHNSHHNNGQGPM